MKKSSATAFLFERPFGSASDTILASWWNAASTFASSERGLWRTADFAREVSHAFRGLNSLPTQNDPHLTDGINDTLRTVRRKSERKPTFSRPYMLLLNHFEDATVGRSGRASTRQKADRHNRPKEYLYSPYYFLRQMLTSPEFLASDAYAHAVLRAEIFSESIVFSDSVARRRRLKGSVLDRVRSFIEFENVSRSLQKAESYRRRSDTFYAADPTDFIVGHLIASRGLALLTFAPGTEQYESARVNEHPLIGRATFLSGTTLTPVSAVYEFRFIDHLDQLPSAAELLNELDGIPLAMPGLDVIFGRGLRTTTARGVVGRISGTSGSGKTSLALGLATAFAPLGTTTRYISCEEDPEDLTKRVVTLTPPFISRTTSFENDLSHWFHAVHLDRGSAEGNLDGAFSLIQEMLDVYESAGINLAQDSPPGSSPLLVVFDGVHELIRRDPHDDHDQTQLLHELVEGFRSLGAVILILSAESDEPALRELDYMVDFVVRLEQTPSRSNGLDSIRRLVLNKTRLQFSRPGSHLLHLSKRDGVRVYPSLSAQLEVFANLKWQPPDNRTWYDFLRTGAKSRGAQHDRPLVDIYHRSQVLVTGKGSGGKAGFGLKLLTKPLLGRDDTLQLPLDELSRNVSRYRARRRILVVSFLYEQEYYDELNSELAKTQKVDSTEHTKLNISVDVLALYPGYLASEVLLAKIIRRLSKAVLEGERYHAVLLDGLHNVFLQYPFLQDSPMVWPVLFEIFRTLGHTLVVTHTRFEVRGMDTDASLRWDVEAATRRVGPLLQSLVNSADFYFDISPVVVDQKSGETALKIELVSALGQDIRSSSYFWDRSGGFIRLRPGSE